MALSVRLARVPDRPAMRFALVLFVLLAIFVALMATLPLNREDVAFLIPYTSLQFSGPRILVLASSLGIGFLLGYLSALPGRIGASRRAKKAEQQLAKVAPATPVAATGVPASRVQPVATGTASDTQSLADEVARRTAAVQRDTPPSV